jgi:NTP pyrophosphatase (non-canonical NTP hydrolase)
LACCPVGVWPDIESTIERKKGPALPDSFFMRLGYDAVMNENVLTLAGFQEHIAQRYSDVDRARGTPATFLWFVEEVGELATALNGGTDRANLEEEFADVIAWLCTLATINNVDLAAAVAQKYLGEKPPEGHK